MDSTPGVFVTFILGTAVVFSGCAGEWEQGEHRSLTALGSVGESEHSDQSGLNKEEIEKLPEKWLNLLRESGYATVHRHSTRIATRRSLLDTHAEPTITFNVTVETQAVMKRDANWLVAWDDDLKQNRDTDQPALVLSFVNGEVTEKVWYPAFKQYRRTKYSSPTSWGANDTQYEYGCQVGKLLGTWLGNTSVIQSFEIALTEIKHPPTACTIDGKRCFEFVYEFVPDLSTLTKGEVKRSCSLFLDETGCLRRMLAVQREIIENDILVEISQTDDYDCVFCSEPPAGANPPDDAVEAQASHL